jgi:hypothetical protein
MTPEVRAIADSLILDTANIKYIAVNLPKRGLDRRVPGSPRNVRELLAHLAAAMARDAEAWRCLARGRPAPGAGQGAPADEQPGARKPKLAELVAGLDGALLACVAALEDLGGTPAGTTPKREVTLALLRERSLHLVRHGLELADAIPELREDAMVLNWLLYADFSGDPNAAKHQLRLFEEVRARFGIDDSDEGPGE